MERNKFFYLLALLTFLSVVSWGQDTIKHTEWKEFRRPRTAKERLEFMRPH